MKESKLEQEKKDREVLVKAGASLIKELQDNDELRNFIVSHAPELDNRLKSLGINISKNGLNPEEKKGLLISINNQA